MTKLHLISAKTCPYVQRAVIVLLEKNIPFIITYIDLTNKPDWFMQISTQGKVPILQVNEHVLFESAIINEYLDETYPPALHPIDPLQRALNRAWIEFGSGLIMNLVFLTRVEDKAGLHKQTQECQEKLAKLEIAVQHAPYFNGQQFSLLDAAYAPFYMRLQQLEKLYPLQLLARFPKLQRWSEQLLARDSVQRSVLPEYPELLKISIKNRQGYVAKQLF